MHTNKNNNNTRGIITTVVVDRFWPPNPDIKKHKEEVYYRSYLTFTVIVYGCMASPFLGVASADKNSSTLNNEDCRARACEPSSSSLHEQKLKLSILSHFLLCEKVAAKDFNTHFNGK